MANSSDCFAALSSWPHSAAFARFVSDLLTDAIAQLRPGRPSIANRLAPDFLDLDSLERFTVAVAMAEALQLPHIASLQVMTGLDNWICEARRSISSSTGDVGFRTSGSTGARKFTVHNFDALAQEIGCLSAVFSDRARIVSLVPAHHIYGFLFTILLPLKLGVEVVDARSQAPATVHSMAKAGDLIVAFPDWWRLLENATWPPDVEGSSSGAPCPVALAQAHRKNGLRLVEVYGSTETGGVGWRDDATAPFRLLPYWERDGDDAVRKLVRGAMKRYALPDLVSWSGNAHLKPVARFDGAVQVGGVNVYPDAVRAALLAHPAVADAAVRLMRPDEGQRLKAFIVSRDAKTPTDELHHALEAWVAERLQPMERPRAFTFGASLPTNAMGKSADWLIAQS